MSDMANVKRVTINFKNPRVYGMDDNSFNDWKRQMTEQNATVIYDRRNNIYCVSPTMDYEMYYNYISYLNQVRGDWCRNGYLDAGMVPYIMWPSFMDNSIVLEQMRNVVRALGIDIITVPAVTYLKQNYVSTGRDYWIFKDDLYKLMKSMEQTSPVYKFDCNSADDATLSKFLKPLADMCISARGGIV